MVVFSTSGLREEAISAFNTFGEIAATQAVPAILLLGPKHLDWANQAKTNDWRATIGHADQMETVAGTVRQDSSSENLNRRRVTCTRRFSVIVYSSTPIRRIIIFKSSQASTLAAGLRNRYAG